MPTGSPQNWTSGHADGLNCVACLVRVAATTTRRAIMGAVGASLALALAGAIVLTERLPGNGTRLLAFPPWAAIALGVTLLVAMAALLVHLARRGRIVGPWD